MYGPGRNRVKRWRRDTPVTPLLPERASSEGPRSTGAVGVTGVPRWGRRGKKLEKKIGDPAAGAKPRALLAAARLAAPWLRNLVDSTYPRIDLRTVLATCRSRTCPLRRVDRNTRPHAPIVSHSTSLGTKVGYLPKRAPSEGPRSTGAVGITGAPRLGRRGK